MLEEEKVVENAAAMGVLMRQHMDELYAKHPSIGEVRSIGLFGALELVKNRKTKEPLPGTAVGPVMKYLRDNGLSTYANGHILMTNPPLVINKDELKEAFKLIDKALDLADKAVVP